MSSFALQKLVRSRSSTWVYPLCRSWCPPLLPSSRPSSLRLPSPLRALSSSLTETGSSVRDGRLTILLDQVPVATSEAGIRLAKRSTQSDPQDPQALPRSALERPPTRARLTCKTYRRPSLPSPIISRRAILRPLPSHSILGRRLRLLRPNPEALTHSPTVQLFHRLPQLHRSIDRRPTLLPVRFYLSKITAGPIPFHPPTTPVTLHITPDRPTFLSSHLLHLTLSIHRGSRNRRRRRTAGARIRTRLCQGRAINAFRPMERDTGRCMVAKQEVRQAYPTAERPTRPSLTSDASPHLHRLDHGSNLSSRVSRLDLRSATLSDPCPTSLQSLLLSRIAAPSPLPRPRCRRLPPHKFKKQQ